MIEALLIQQLSSLLAPALPYLMGAATIAGKKAADSLGGKIGDEAWSKAQHVWDKLRPWAEKKPEVAKALKEVAENADDPIYTAILPLNLKKLLEEMPTQTVNEIRNIVIQAKSESRITTADRGGVAIGGDVSGGMITAAYHSYDNKSE